MRRYRLGGLITGLLLLAALAVWKNAARLIPLPARRDGSEEIVTGKDSFGGVLNLLRRNVAPGELLQVCLAEWAKHQPGNREKTDQEMARARTLLTPDGGRVAPGQAARIYGEVTAMLKETRWKPRT